VDANQFFSIANQASPTLDAFAQGTPGLALPSGKTDFANLFNGQMLAQMRQEFAAPVPVQVDLQLVSLGPKINLITADAPLPDMESLASFARAQGLDEEAVRTLFGGSSTLTSQKLTDLLDQDLAQGTPDTTVQLAPVMASVPTLVVPIAVAARQAPVSAPSTAPIPSPANAATLVDLLDQGTAQGTLDTTAPLAPVVASVPTPVVAITVAAKQAPVSAPSAAPMTSPANAAKLVDLLDQDPAQGIPDMTAPLASVMASVPTPVVAITVAAKQAPVSATSAGSNLIAANGNLRPNLMSLGTAATAELPQTPADSIKTADPLIAYLVSVQMSARQQTAVPVTNAPVQDMPSHAVADPMQLAMRVRLDVQSQEITRRLSLMSGSSQKASWAAIAGSGITDTGLTKPWETLHIDIPSVPLSGLSDSPIALISDLAAGIAPLYGGSGETAKTFPSDAATASNAEPPSESVLLAQRSAQYQQLADRIGQSLGERLLSQIERGEWSLKLRLQPESLGRVDVALAMHAGALDASFASDNSMTRDLILQGAAKLRDTLAQSGMAVATVWVGGDQGRKHDGNPTPGRSFKSASGAIRKSDAEPVLGVSSPGRPSTTSEGLDVLA
jgi:flagellar hook-length control protein FliK